MDRQFIVVFLLLLLFPPFFSNSQITAKEANNSSFTVSVRCSTYAMEMFVQFKEPFNGRLKVRPDGQCFVNGRGRLNVGFRLPLDEKHRKKCSIIRREAEFIAIVDLEMNSNLTNINENSYFVRCPILSKEIQEKESGNLSARIGPLGTEMHISEKGKGQMMNLSLETTKRQKAHFRQCIAFSHLPDGKLQAVHLKNENSSCGQFSDEGHNFIQFWPPDFEGKIDSGKFFVQCEIVQNEEGNEQQSACTPNSSSIGPLHRSLASIQMAYPLSDSTTECSSPAHHLEHYLLAILLGILLALGIASICLIGVHLLGKRQNRRQNNRAMLLMGQREKKNSKRVQIVCPTISSSTAAAHYLSNSSILFGSSPIQQPALFCCPPPSPPPALSHQCPAECPQCPSPTSTMTTALALSLDKLPEPPSLSLAEIGQLNLAFNGFMLDNGNGNENGEKKEEEYLHRNPKLQQQGEMKTTRIYSFGGIRLNSQQFGRNVEMNNNNNGWINY